MSEAILHSICISSERGRLKNEVPEATVIADFGIQGDGHAGDWGRQITCLDLGLVRKSNQEHGLSMGPGEFAENLCIENMQELDLQVGDEFCIGESTTLVVTQIGKPDEPSVVTRTFGISLLPYEGRFCRVVRGGQIRKGDVVYKKKD